MKNSATTEATTITSNLYEEVTNKIISMIEQGVAPWRRTWSTYGLARNYGTDHIFTCINLILSKPSRPFSAITTKYFLEVSDQNGCTALDSIIIKVREFNSDIYVPNIFSPNGDNINDIWMPILSDPKSNIISLSIYDRLGNKVFDCTNKTDNITQCGWNGMFADKKCLPGVYVYLINWQNQKGISKTQAGNLILLR